MKQHLNLYSRDKKLLPMKYIRTPKNIWDDLISEFNFTVDACASDNNHLIDRYWTKENSALDKNWDGEIVYCHPMFDRNIPNFIEKAASSKCLCVFLLPASTNAVYFHQYFWDSKNNIAHKNVEIRFLEKPKGLYGYKFNDEYDNEPKTGYLRPLMIVVMDNRIRGM